MSLARELAFDPSLRLEARHVNPFVLGHLCRIADEKISYGDRDCLRVSALCCRIARQLATAEGHAQSFGRLASALRFANRLSHANLALKIAMDAASQEMRGDLVRRRAIIRIYEGNLVDARGDAEEAIKLTTGVEHARALEALGIVLYYSGENPAALRELGRCLTATQPDDPGYCNAIHNYATALAEGTDEEAAQAVKLCRKLRKKLKDRHKMPRAKLWWTEGLLHHRLGDAKTAWWSLEIAQRSLVALEAAPEVAAIVADMARVSPEPMAVRCICREAEDVIATRRPLRQPLRALASAARDMIPEAAAALKEAASKLAPCPAL